MSVEGKCATTFLNVDIDLRSRSALDELLKQLEPCVLVLNQSGQDASIELNAQCTSLDECLAKWIELVQSLPDKGKAAWDRCEFRRMNIGIQAGHEPHAAHFALSSGTVLSLASLQTDIVFTVYAATCVVGTTCD
jgi:hypothetical protein